MRRHQTSLPALILVVAAALSAQATPPAGAKRPVAASDSVRVGATNQSDTAHRVLINREVFAYDAGGRRDPFVSLMNTSELRPLLTELKLVAVAYDPVGGNSVAVLRDLTSKEQYRVRVGQALGRMRVAAIHEKEVVFTIEEFGFSRQETLSMVDSTKTRPPR